MQAIINHSVTPGVENPVRGLYPAYLYSNGETYLNWLWAKVCDGDLVSFETFHSILYPQLFNYACFILKDEKVADNIIATAFIDFFNKKTAIYPSNIKVELTKHIRRAALACLVDPANKTVSQPVNLLFILNSNIFRKNEMAVLGVYLKFDQKAIAEIII
jgi:hypothetical protein